MTDNHSSTADSNSSTPVKRAPFPLTRLFYAIFFAVVAWFVFWIALFFGLVQWIVTAVSGDHDDTLKHWSRNLNQYLWEVLSFIVFAREERPFPFGSPFPKM